MFQQVLASPLVPKVAPSSNAAWDGPWTPSTSGTTASNRAPPTPRPQLDEITRKKYPTPEAYHQDMPRMFEALGLAGEGRVTWPRISWWTRRAARGTPGRANCALRPLHLRTRVGPNGMDYKGYTSPSTRWATTWSRPSR